MNAYADGRSSFAHRVPLRESVLGGVVLVLSGLGFPLTQALIARCGRRGAVVAEGLAVGLLVRDATLVRSGLPARLQPLPRRLLLLELSAAVLATLAGPVAIVRPSQQIEPTAAGALEAFRRFAVGVLFGLHSYRFRIYLGRDRGILAPIGRDVETPSRRPRG
jgi:hypothetical protein